MTVTTAQRELAAGCVLVVLGGGVAAGASRYKLGTPGSMGPGAFPLILGLILALMGALIMMNRHSAAEEHEPTPGLDLRGGLCVVGGVVAFTVLAAYAGFAPATFACIFIGAMGDRTASIAGSALLAGTATGLGMLLFVYALGMPLPVWHWGGL